MQVGAEIKRFGEHHNAFGFLRLLFASLVIVSHTPEMVSGNRDHELLTRFFGTISFGDLAVDGFFIVSGYLIVGSWLKRPRIWPYLKKRIARIYPAFIVASLLCIAIVAPLGGGDPALGGLSTWARATSQMLRLYPPEVAGSFAGTPYPVLNGAMWTIAYEFRCYVLIMVLGILGAFRRPWLIVMLAIGLLALFALTPGAFWQRNLNVAHLPLLFGELRQMVRLSGIYLMGCAFYLYRDAIRFTRPATTVAAMALFGCMFMPRLAEPAVATFGAYLVFAFAAWGGSGLISRINNRNDISYGVYLYAWPTEKLLNWYWPLLSLPVLGFLTFVIACGLGWASWHFVEKPVMRRLR